MPGPHSDSLGFIHRDCPGVRKTAPVTTTVEIVAAPPPVSITKRMTSWIPFAPQGLFAILLYSSLAITVPVLHDYLTIDYTTDLSRGVVIGIAAATALLVPLASDACTLYNILLFFHIGNEVIIVDKSLAFAMNTANATADIALAYTGAIVVILHLIPFLILDIPLVLIILAMAGVVVNVAIAVYLVPSQLLLIGFSATALLTATILVEGISQFKPSLLSNLRKGRFLTCLPM